MFDYTFINNIMVGKSLGRYVFFTLVSSTLYLSIILSYGAFALVHLIVFILGFYYLLFRLKFESNLSPYLFALIPCVAQNIAVYIFVLLNSDAQSDLTKDFYGKYIGIIMSIVSIIEFVFLYFAYLKYQKSSKVR